MYLLKLNKLRFFSFLDGQRDQKFFRKDYSYLEAVEGFYKIHRVPQTWADAKRTCAQEGAGLFYPENETEAQAVISFWSVKYPNIGAIFLGLSDILVEGVFETIDGTYIIIIGYILHICLFSLTLRLYFFIALLELRVSAARSVRFEYKIILTNTAVHTVD